MTKIAKCILAIFIATSIICGCNSTENNGTLSASSSQSTVSLPQLSEDTEISEKFIDTSSVYDFEKKYFVNKLDNDMLEKFVTLYNAISSFQKSVDFTVPITEDELDILMYLLNYDCPELIHISGNYFPEYTDSSCTKVSAVTFSYIMEQSEYINKIGELNSFFDELKQTLNGKSDTEKEKYVYNYIFDNCIYNETNEFSGSAYGAIIEHTGRCEAFSKSFLWCMHELDIECMALIGEPKWETDALFPTHSWNIVKINGNYYHLDITVDSIQTDDNTKSPPSYGFYNVDDSLISESRIINPIYENLGVPECNSTEENYHIINNQYIDGNTDVKSALNEILTEKFDDGLDNISVKFKNSDDYTLVTENIDSYITDILSNIFDDQYTYTTFFNDLAHTIVFQAKLSEE